MTLDEAIKHCEEIAETQEWMANGYDDDSMGKKLCLECASEHRQLAEWLRELNAYRKAEKEIEQELVNWNDIDNGKCRGLFLATSIIQHYKDEEVNADEDKGVLEKINEKQDSLGATCKAWDEAISRDGYVD